MVHLAKLLSAAAAIITLALVADSASAHPGEHHQDHVETEAQVAHRKLFNANALRSLKACANSPHVRKLKEQAIVRRAAKVEQLRQEQAAARSRRHLQASTVLAKSHKSSLTGVTTATDAATLFGANPKCILEPGVTEGPYYVRGELIRNDIREQQEGVDLYSELQIIDVNTCKPVENLYVDFWHCNSTGVYSGVVASGNGDRSDASNAVATFNRGLAPTDANGLVNFTTTFPGHYTGRAHHIHILGTHGGTLQANNTYVGGSVSHVGQIFFDQDLITQVEATAPYTTNTQTLTTNARDSILSQSAGAGFDPVMEYTLLGDSIEDGVFAWISIGVDMTLSRSVSAAATLTSADGVISASGATTSGGASTVSSTSAPSTGGSTSTTPAPSSTTSESPAVRAASAALVAFMAATALLIQ